MTIKYIVNALPKIGTYYEYKYDRYTHKRDIVLRNEDVNIMDIMVESGDLEIFHSKNLKYLIDYKWKNYAFYFHFN